MSQTTLTFYSRINGELVDLDSLYLADESGDFGVRRVDNLDVVVPFNTTVSRLSLGHYAYTFTDPEPGLTYEYTLKIDYNGTVFYYNRNQSSADINNLILIPSSSHYSSQAEVYRILGSYAAELMIDDYAGEDKGYIWADLLYDADSTIWMYTDQHYNIDSIYSNQWVRRRATYLVANLLSQRRGNAELFRTKVERIYDELNMVRDGRMRIPRATVSHWMGPNVRNYVVQEGFLNHASRVEKTKSTGDSYSGEDIAWEPYYFTYRV